MKKVFVFGSSKCVELSSGIISALDEIIQRNDIILVGDCTEFDSLVQEYLKEHNYKNVIVSGAKDLEMIYDCDYALAVWDKKSRSTIRNIDECQRVSKKVYLVLV